MWLNNVIVLLLADMEYALKAMVSKKFLEALVRFTNGLRD